MAGDREITVNAAAAAIASKAPGLSPFLLMKHSTVVAEPLVARPRDPHRSPWPAPHLAVTVPLASTD